MQGRCDKHLFEQAEDRCGACGGEYCAECLVYSFGPKRPPYCIACAVAAAGIRSAAAGRALPRREARRLEKERHRALKMAARAAKAAARVEAATPVTPPAPAPERAVIGFEPSVPPLAAR